MKITIATAVTALAICVAASFGHEAAVASPGGAANNEQWSEAPLTSVVHFSDLNVSNVDGAKRLYARLRRAASEVCEPLESASAGSAAEHHACVTKVIGDAVANINLPLLSEYHRLQTAS
jgi:UrcA family protein